MNQEMRSYLGKLIMNMGIYYGKPLPKEVISMMIDDLCDLDFHKVIEAYNQYRRKPTNKFFPMPGDIRSMIAPEPSLDGQAREITTRIIESINKFGWCDGAGARAHIGEIGWSAIKRFGGWSYVCENHGRELDAGIFQAQTREIVKIFIEGDKNPNYQALLEQGLQKTPRDAIEERKTLLLDQFEQLKNKGVDLRSKKWSIDDI